MLYSTNTQNLVEHFMIEARINLYPMSEFLPLHVRLCRPWSVVCRPCNCRKLGTDLEKNPMGGRQFLKIELACYLNSIF